MLRRICLIVECLTKDLRRRSGACNGNIEVGGSGYSDRRKLWPLEVMGGGSVGEVEGHGRKRS